jgi:hypothetical protein
LCKLANKLDKKDVEIIPNNDFFCDRSLSGVKFSQVTNYIIPSWDDMLDELAALIIGKRRL